jgi:hypothetical protein
VRQLLGMHDEQFSFARHAPTKLRQIAAAVQAQSHNLRIGEICREGRNKKSPACFGRALYRIDRNTSSG